MSIIHLHSTTPDVVRNQGQVPTGSVVTLYHSWLSKRIMTDNITVF